MAEERERMASKKRNSITEHGGQLLAELCPFNLGRAPGLETGLLNNIIIKQKQNILVKGNIRASVDALRRDDMSEFSRDPRTKRLQTRRESLARPSKHTNNNF